MTKLNDKLIKGQFTSKEYAEAAVWANSNRAMIEDKGTYFEIVALPPEPEKTYAEKRAAEYPSITEQLDMIYWDGVNGTTNWQDKIAEIKERFPK